MESNENNYLLHAKELSDEDIHCITEALIGTLIVDEHIPQSNMDNQGKIRQDDSVSRLNELLSYPS